MDALFSLGQWIKRRRKALDLTQEAFAQRVGCSKELIAKIEADARRPSRQIVERLAHQLELPSRSPPSYSASSPMASGS